MQTFFRILKYKNEEVMKKLLVMLLFSTAMFSQTIKVRGVTLSYDKVHKTIILIIPEKLMRVYDIGNEVKVMINKQYSLRMIINGMDVATYSEYFLHQGHSYENMWMFSTIQPDNCIEVKRNYVYKFTNVQSNEYILQVSNICDNKWESNQQNYSIIVN
jgi:hypothetical protein